MRRGRVVEHRDSHHLRESLVEFRRISTMIYCKRLSYISICMLAAQLPLSVVAVAAEPEDRCSQFEENWEKFKQCLEKKDWELLPALHSGSGTSGAATSGAELEASKRRTVEEFQKQESIELNRELRDSLDSR
jgi:hypothetical protein